MRDGAAPRFRPAAEPDDGGLAVPGNRRTTADPGEADRESGP